MSHPSRPPPSPPSPPSPLSLSARVLLPAPAPAPALVSASASASSKQPSGCEALAHPHCHLHPSSQSVVTPPDSFREPSSSPINECECEREQHEEHQHKHNYQTQNIIQHLRRLQDGRVHSLHSWHVFPLSHHELLALHDSIETEGATLAAYFYDKVRYDYFYFWQQFVLRMPLLASHEIVIRDIDAEIVAQLRAKTSPTQARALKSLGSKTYDLPDDPQQGRDSGCNSHSPDASFGLAGEQYPGVVLEVANTQKAKFLDQIADDYIVGSEGHVRVVVAIMFNYGSSEKATLSIWRSTVAQNAEGQWEHFCQNTMREMAFRDELGQSDPICPGLELQLCDFALALRDEPASPANRVYIPPLQLCSIVDEALRSQAQSQQNPPTQRAADRLPTGFVHRKRQRTPPEQITSEDEACWEEAEERAEKKSRTEDPAWSGRREKLSGEGPRRRMRSETGERLV